MELNKLNSSQVGAAQISEQGKVQKKAIDKEASAAKNSVAPSGDRVEISSDAAVLAKGMETIKNTADVRQDRVASLKAAIKAGTYKTDARKIADKMLDSSLEESILLGRKGS